MSVCLVCWCRLLWSSHIRLLLVFFICTSHTHTHTHYENGARSLSHAVTSRTVTNTHIWAAGHRNDASKTAKLCVRATNFPNEFQWTVERMRENDKYSVTATQKPLSKGLNASTEPIHFVSRWKVSSEISLIEMHKRTNFNNQFEWIFVFQPFDRVFNFEAKWCIPSRCSLYDLAFFHCCGLWCRGITSHFHQIQLNKSRLMCICLRCVKSSRFCFF